MPWTVTAPVGPEECPVSFREYLLGPTLPRPKPEHGIWGDGRESVEGCANVFCPPNVTTAQVPLESGTESHRSYEDHGSFQAPTVSWTIMCLGSGVPHGPTSVYLLPHGRPYTRGFSVCRVTSSAQTSFFFLPARRSERRLPLQCLES